jgi:hypothetical protein
MDSTTNNGIEDPMFMDNYVGLPQEIEEVWYMLQSKQEENTGELRNLIAVLNDSL